MLANIVVQLTQEIGIRMALGASARSVMWLVLRRGIILMSLGTGALARLPGGLYEVRATGADPGITRPLN